ncbi:MAG: hypothetical protein PHR26_03310 [Candidatus ainarchaeum sp.]|nr:hypothetical protein [Candidatus ainarchaeum sp.]MDD3975980.1 hypothetical protein [Candidatus ainarchaeum sp.]
MSKIGLNKRDLKNISYRFNQNSKKNNTSKIFENKLDLANLNISKSVFKDEINSCIRSGNYLHLEKYLNQKLNLDLKSQNVRFKLLNKLEHTFIEYMLENLPNGGKITDKQVIFLNNKFYANLINLRVRKKITYEELNKRNISFLKMLKTISTKVELVNFLNTQISIIEKEIKG